MISYASHSPQPDIITIHIPTCTYASPYYSTRRYMALIISHSLSVLRLCSCHYTRRYLPSKLKSHRIRRIHASQNVPETKEGERKKHSVHKEILANRRKKKVGESIVEKNYSSSGLVSPYFHIPRWASIASCIFFSSSAMTSAYAFLRPGSIFEGT